MLESYSSGVKESGDVTIASGASQSGAIYIGGGVVAAIITPAAWTAADITFLGSVDGTNYYPILDDTGTEVKVASANIPTASARMLSLDINDFIAPLYIKVRSGTASAGVNQGADRTIKVIARVV